MSRRPEIVRSKSLDLPTRPPLSNEEATRAFLALCGSWDDARSAREIAADIRRQRRPGKRLSRIRDNMKAL